MLDDMQDMLFSATSRNSAWVESSAILFLEGEKRKRVLNKGSNCKRLRKYYIPSRNYRQLGWEKKVLLPEQAQKLTQGQLEGNQELCFIQQWESLLADVAFNDYLREKTHLMTTGTTTLAAR